MHTLSQRLGSFLTESRVQKFFLCRHDYSLRSLINRDGFHALGEEKIEQKIGQKPAFLAQFSCNRFSLFFLSPLWPLAAATTLITGLPTIISTTISHQNISHRGCIASLSPLQNFSFLPPRPQQQQPPRPEALVLPNGS